MKKLLLLAIVLVTCVACLSSCGFINWLFGCKHKNVEVDPAVTATCTQTGLTEGKHCKKCGEILVKQEVVPLAHNYSEWEIIKEPDCIFKGEKTRSCLTCQTVDNAVIEPIPHTFVQNSETKLFSCSSCEGIVYAGHFYALIDIPSHWFEAYEICESVDGYLATITSSKEQAIITSMVSNGKVDNGNREWITEEGYWLGAIKNTNGWEWITGEKFDYTNWDQNEPENDIISWFLGINTYGEWHDCHHTHNGSTGLKIICEWELYITESEHYFTEWETVTEVDCFKNGEQYRLCTHCGIGETKIIDQLQHNFVFNEATGITSCEHCSAAMYDGRMYKIFNAQLSWLDAYSYCDDIGGHLVTITSQEEQTFIENYMKAQSFTDEAWIGSYSTISDWHWVTDESFDYTNWDGNQPDCDRKYEYFGTINHGFGRWNDRNHLITYSFICEWEAE